MCTSASSMFIQNTDYIENHDMKNYNSTPTNMHVK